MYEGEGAAVSNQLSALLNAIDSYSRNPLPVDGPDHQLGIDLPALRSGIDRLELTFAQLSSRIEGSGIWFLEGSTSPGNWVRHNCRMSMHSAYRSMTVGELAARLPASVEALLAGEIGYEHLGLIAALAKKVDDSETSAWKFDEAVLLADAKEMSVSRFRHVVRKIRHMFDRVGLDRDGIDNHDRRRFSFTECEDGMVAVEGLFSPADGATLKSAITPLADYLNADDHRTREMRMADALVEVATRVLDSGTLPVRRRQRAHVQVTTSLETLMGLPGAPAADMEFTLPITTKTVQRLACGGSITRILLDSKSQVIDVGREKRAVPAALSRALHARDRHCVWPGCQRAAAWCEEHHLQHWASGGETAADNLALVCHHHHWLLHEGGWQMAMTAEGKVVTIGPQYSPGDWRPPDWRPPRAEFDLAGLRELQAIAPRIG